MINARAALLGALALAAGPAVAGAPEAGEAWFRILSDDGQLIGIQHERAAPSGDGWEVSRETELAFRVEGHEATVSGSRYRASLDRNGSPVRIELVDEQNDRRVSTTIEFADGKAHISRKAGSKITTYTHTVPGGLAIVDRQALLGIGSAESSAPALEYDTSTRDFARVELRTLAPTTAGAIPRVTLSDGEPSQILLLGFDPGGAVTRAAQPLLGNRVVIERADGALSTDDLSRGRTIPHQLVRAPYAIPRSALQGHMRYHFSLTADVGIPFPETGDQRVLRQGNGLQFDVCDGCGPGLSTAPEDLERWRQPTPWLQSDQAPLRDIGAQYPPGTASQRSVMEALGRRARDRLKDIDYNGHYSALQAWRRRKGDCTEDAALYAALARAAGIPARVASGVAYSRERYHGASETFVPHSWVIAYVDGKWQDFDIAIDGFDASHLAFSIGDGEPQSIAAANQLAGLLEWTDMVEVRKRPES